MKILMFTLLLCLSVAARGEDWVLISADDTTRIFLDASSVNRATPGEPRITLKLAYSNRRDMMSLEYNGALKKLVIACEKGLVLYQQQFLLNDDDVVWTFPETTKPEPVGKALPDAVVRKVCS